MPFGLKGAPATFQRLMNTVLSGLIGIKCFVYLDDIVVYGRNIVDHNKKLSDVFECLRKFNLKLNPNKCIFMRKEVVYLGHIITQHGIKPDPSKISAIINYPVPEDTKSIKTFLGLVGYYRRFIGDFSKIAHPLTSLLKKNATFTWTAFCDEAFNNLRNALTISPILQFPDFTQTFLITTDASDIAIGAILSQMSNSSDLPIAYASRTLNKAETNYPTIEKELLAIVWGVNQFRPYIYGTKFKIITDHKPLIWLWKVNNPTSRLLRWRIKLDEYDYQIVHKPGKANCNADSLSRIKLNPLETKQLLVTTRSQTKTNLPNANSEDENQIKSSIPTDPQTNLNNTTEDEIKTLDNEKDILSIIEEFHVTPIGGHQGISRTYKRLRRYYYFPKMFKRIEKFIQTCESCQKNKHLQMTKVPMKITTTSTKPFEKIFLDIVGPLLSSHNKNKYILTVQDDLSKYSIAVPIPVQDTEVVAKAFVEEVICIYGSPKSILTDQGSNFMSELFQDVCKLLQIKKYNSTAYHPQTNGSLERSHKNLGEYLRNFSSNDPLNWDSWLKYAMFAYNTTPHTSTELMPFEILFGFKPNLPHSLSDELSIVYYDDYLSDLKFKLQNSYKLARENLIKTKHRTKEYYDRNSRYFDVNIGDFVLLKNEARKTKNCPLWLGPFKIVNIPSLENSEIEIGKTRKLVHNNRLKKFVSQT